ncbi:hypothetical protein C2S51_001661 [Perilla frutescens var. frutescens]|nr:hypothetical protein C2S51_001661 [Perilla frutescens var. frutescens]
MGMDCKLCFKRFSNGKALGAHMRSHYAILPLPPKTPQRYELSEQLTESTESVLSCDERESSGDKSLLSGTYGLREKPRKSFRLPDPEFFDVGSVAVDGESESGSTRARFKKSKGLMKLDDDQEVSKEESGMGMEEDVALCLIMLSRDVWRKKSDDLSKKIYRCDKCDKVFKSSQGLGSHKASHSKKIKNSFLEKESVSVVVGDQVHECALCPRIFKSAQALGGHKKSHFPLRKFGRNLVDLNLPAAVEVVNEEIVA